MFDGDKEPVRKYLNTKVTGVLMEGMKKIGAEQYVLLSVSSCFY